MAINVKKRIFFLVFCLASITQGMYSTYFVSILTTIERIYQIQSKTAGAIMSATEVGQIAGSLIIAYYGGKGNKPKWIAACMTLAAIAALISTYPHFLLNIVDQPSSIITTTASPYLTSDLSQETLSTSLSSSSSSMRTKLRIPTREQLCYQNIAEPFMLNSTESTGTMAASWNQVADGSSAYQKQGHVASVLVIFFFCLLAIGFGSTAITTLGISFIDDIVSKEESPLYLGLTIGLRIFGPALGFLLGSFCMQIDVNLLTLVDHTSSGTLHSGSLPQATISGHHHNEVVGAWWLGLIIISIPLLFLAIPMYYLSLLHENKDDPDNDFENITYQAAEDHDIGDSGDFPPHVLTIADLDVTSDRTCYSEVDSSSREVLQSKTSSHFNTNFGKNIGLDLSSLAREGMLSNNKLLRQQEDSWKPSCVVVNHFGGLESTSLSNDESRSLNSSFTATSSADKSSAKNLTNSLARLIKNKLLLFRMLSGVLHILPIAGFYTFLPKYLTEQFRIAPSSANAISGLAGILFVGFGAFLGGMIVRLFNVNARLMTRWIATSALLYAIGMLILLNLGCPQNQTIYHESNEYTSTNCLTTCNCSTNIYNPVCANGTTYISPCLAGCKAYSISEDKIIYDECGCPDPHQTNQETHLNLNVATQGHCLVDCDNLKWYIIIFSTFTLIHASCEVGAVMFNLRCVRSSDRTLALGLITFTSSLLGTIPCSVIYGAVIDLTCIHWDTVTQIGEATGIRGACRAYENDSFRYYLHGVTALVMFFAFIVDCIISRYANEVDFYDTTDKKDVTTVRLKKSTETI